MPQTMAPNPKGVLKVGVVSDIGIPFTAKSNEQWLGFDIELSSRFAAWLGREVEWVDMPFGSLLPSLISGKIDMIAASVMITEERSKQIDFSDPYYASGVSILGRKSNETSSLSGQNSEGDAVSPTFWKKLSDSFYNNLILEKRYMMIVRGLYVTILISLLAALFGTLLGGLVCAMRMSKNSVVKAIAIFYISLIRGTPVLVLLMIIYYVIFSSININPVIVAMIAFGINFAAYVSEMFRTSIESIDKGQHEAGIAGGFTKAQTFLHIMMPQAIRRVLPVYKGEFISLVKMTSVVGYIAVEDLTKASDIIRSRTFDAFFPLLMAAVIYILLSWLLTIGLNRIEINLDPRKRIRRIHIRKEIVQ
jgi:polar amino acid transport system substrate-binding protein